MEVIQDEHAPNTTMCHHAYFETNGFFEERRSSEKSSKIINNSSSSSLSSPGSTNNNSEGLGLGFHVKKYGSSVELETDHSSNSSNSSFISFKTPPGGAGSLLSFDQRVFSQEDSFSRMMINISSHVDDDDGNDYSIWEDDNNNNNNNNNNSHYNYNQNQIQQMLQQNSNNINGTASASASNEVNLGWLSSDEPNNAIQVLGRPESCSFNKRPYAGESTQALKKQCTAGVTKMPKSNKSKDPQSIAAKIRRERISERLKILQDLVPNGSKVDLVTMLEKAISYVKFLQLQVKVLATDEFWPAQGGKAPELSQVREAIDAILASQRDRNSTSKY